MTPFYLFYWLINSLVCCFSGGFTVYSKHLYRHSVPSSDIGTLHIEYKTLPIVYFHFSPSDIYANFVMYCACKFHNTLLLFLFKQLS